MTITSKDLIKALKRLGFVVEQGRGKGSHTWLAKDGITITVPQEKGDIPQGTLSSVIRKLKELGISKDDILRKGKKSSGS